MTPHPNALVDPGAIAGAFPLCALRLALCAPHQVVCDGAVIGEDCNLCDRTFFEKGGRLGNRVTIK